MNGPLVAAGILGVLGAAVHGGAGELLVMRRLSPSVLPATSFGGAELTRAMIHVAWHIATVAFLTAGVALLLAGTVLEGDSAEGIALVAAGAFTGFAAVVLGLGAIRLSPRTLYRHPGPAVLTGTAVLAWWGAL